MKTEKQKMLDGDLYNALDNEISNERIQARLLLKQFNDSPEDELTRRKEILGELIPNGSTDLIIQPPFYCDYGYNLRIGMGVFFNFNCTALDVTTITIGNGTLIGPNVQLYTALHPMSATERATGLEFARPIRIGDDVWIGGGAIICPGVTIGDRAVIGAGSIVTKDIPSDVFAAGNPCRVVRKLGDP